MPKTRPLTAPLKLTGGTLTQSERIVNALAARLMGWAVLEKSPDGNPTPQQVRNEYVAWSMENMHVYATLPGSPRWDDDRWRVWNPAVSDGDALRLLCAYPEISVRGIAGECLYVCDMGETLVRAVEKRFRFAVLSLLANMAGVTADERAALEHLMGHKIVLQG